MVSNWKSNCFSESQGLRPHLVQVLGLVTPHRAIGRPSPLLLPWSWSLQPLLPPEAVHPLVVHQSALAPQQAVGHAPAPADVLSRDLPEVSPQLGLRDADDFAAMALGARCWPTTRQTNCSETRNSAHRA